MKIFKTKLFKLIALTSILIANSNDTISLAATDNISDVSISSSSLKDESGKWGTVTWSFAASTGVLTLSTGSLENVKAAPWYGDSPIISPQNIKKIIISNNIQAPADSSYLFGNLTSLTTIEGLSNLNTTGVTDMSSLFSGDASLTELSGLGTFDTTNVTDMSSLFTNTYELSDNTFAEIKSWNTSKVTDMSFMFEGIGATTLDLSNFVTSNVTNMASMFRVEDNLKDINLSSFDTSKVTSMSRMFNSAASLTDLDISSFNTNSVTSMGSMFKGCDSLESIKLGVAFKFSSDAALGTPVAVGGKGTGNWIKNDKTSKGYSPSDFMSNYGTGDLSSGKYIAEIIGISVNTKDSSLYVGDSWSPVDNFVNATDVYGNHVDFSEITVSGDVDTTRAGTYDITYSYQGVSSIAKITVKENQTAVNVHDSILYIGQDANWTPDDNFDTAFDKDGNSVLYSQITVDDSQMIDPEITIPGEYDIKYSYGGVTSVAHVSVREQKEALNVHNSTISLGDSWGPEDNFDSALDIDGNQVSFDQVNVNGTVDTTKIGSYNVVYSFLGLKKTATINVISPFKITVPSTSDFGTYKLGSSNSVLNWNKSSKVEVEGADSSQWDLSVALNAKSSLKGYIKIGDQTISDQPQEVISGTGSMDVTGGVSSDNFIKVDYTGVKQVRKDTGNLEWILTPSTKEVSE